jgi:hypothetical protein
MSNTVFRETGNNPVVSHASAVAVEMFGFDKDDNVKTIPLHNLAKSVRVEGKSGRTLQTRPVQSWSLIATIIAMLSEHNINYHEDPIYISKKNSFPRINDEDKSLGYNREVCPINKWEFDKVIGSVTLPNLGNDLANGKIAFSFYDKGITLALGTNVHVCSNFSILGGSLIRTFTEHGRPGYSWESIEAMLEKWFRNIDQKIHIETTIMQRMMQREISNEAVIDNVIGDLYKRAIKQAYFKGNDAPFDTHGMSYFVQEVIKQKKEEEKVGNVWDLYNWGTAIMKPGTIDLASIVESSKMFADYLCLEFGIEREDLFTEAEVVQ